MTHAGALIKSETSRDYHRKIRKYLSVGFGSDLSHSYVDFEMATKWDPVYSDDWDKEKVLSKTVARIQRLDIPGVMGDYRPLNMFVLPEEDDITKFHVLMSGQTYTPYEGGFFYFFVRLPPDYPSKPPRVKLMNTDDGKVRFNPNIYDNGKVCISMIGTWAGQPWKSEYKLKDVLEAIQKQMNEKPYHNEPMQLQGMPFVERNVGDAEKYNEIICHETLRVAVCDMMEGKVPMPDKLREKMKESFPAFWKFYQSICQNKEYLQGKDLEDPFVPLELTAPRLGKFDFPSIWRRLLAIRKALEEENDRVKSTEEETELASNNNVAN